MFSPAFITSEVVQGVTYIFAAIYALTITIRALLSPHHNFSYFPLSFS